MFTYNYLYLYITRNYHTSVLVGQHLVYHDPTRASFHLAPRSRLVVRECSELSAGATGGREREARTVINRVGCNFPELQLALPHHND